MKLLKIQALAAEFVKAQAIDPDVLCIMKEVCS
jgi:hypothetical protein